MSIAPRRWFQFRLSTWFVLIAIMAVAMLVSMVLVTNLGFSRLPSRGGWSTVPPSDIVATNRVRAANDIRQIKNDWLYYGHEFNADDWLYANRQSAKRVQRDSNGAIHWEQDYYFSGRTYIPRDPGAGSVPECLSIYFDYPTSTFSVAYSGADTQIQSLVNTLSLTTAGWKGTSNQATLTTADSILRRWNESRL